MGLVRSLAIYHLIPRRQRPLRALYGEFVSAGDLAFDIGAHVGNRTRALVALGCRVVAVEPQPAVAATLRASPLDTFFSVVLPLARPAYLTAAVMGFAHTVGEFGIVLMLGGNIPGKTRVVSVQIYDHVEALEYTQAHWLAGGLMVFSFVTLLALHLLQPRARLVSRYP